MSTKVTKNEIAVTEKKSVQPAASTPTPTDLISLAIANNADVDKLKELMDLQERWEKKEARKKFFEALALFQSKVPAIPKAKVARVDSQRTGRSFSYKYADLGTITKTIKKSLEECGLSYRWEFQEANNRLRVTCFVSHREGHTETSSMEAGMDASGSKNDIQQKGSTQTYLQRYTLIGALGISTADEDNDGRDHATTHKKVEPSEASEDDFLDYWKTEIDRVRTQAELTKLYISNKKVVDGSDEIKALFKQREAKIKASANGNQQAIQLP